MRYEDMSDFELNCRLLELSAPSDTKITSMRPHRLARKLKRTFSHVVFTIDGEDCEFQANFCRNWNETIPLADEYGIETVKCKFSTEAFSTPSQYKEGWRASVGDIFADSESRLRAIVICLIEVLEAKK